MAVGIILLFIGVAVAPSINFNVAKASNDNDLVEVTTQAYGIKGFGNTTVKLTREQYKNLEEYLVEFRTRLNQTSTREEAVPIFKEAVVELNKYGLLPKGMSVEKAQKLVIRLSFNEKSSRLFNKLLKDNQENRFCLITVKITNSKSFGAFYPIRLRLSLIGENLGDFWMVIWAISELLLEVRSIFFPLYLFGEFSVGYKYEWYTGDISYYPSTGTILSIGMYGPKSYTGDFYGQIRQISELHLSPVGYNTYYSGMIGFTGLNIRTSEHDNFLIGSCLLINLGPSPP